MAAREASQLGGGFVGGFVGLLPDPVVPLAGLVVILDPVGERSISFTREIGRMRRMGEKGNEEGKKKRRIKENGEEKKKKTIRWGSDQ